MARCFQCRKDITAGDSFVSSFINQFRYIFKFYFGGSLVTCPHCSAVNRETLLSLFLHLLWLLAYLLAAFLLPSLSPGTLGMDNPYYVAGFLVFAFVGEYVWWTFFAVLDKPWR